MVIESESCSRDMRNIIKELNWMVIEPESCSKSMRNIVEKLNWMIIESESCSKNMKSVIEALIMLDWMIVWSKSCSRNMKYVIEVFKNMIHIVRIWVVLISYCHNLKLRNLSWKWNVSSFAEAFFRLLKKKLRDF